MIDYHIHTPLCNHAYGTMNAYILSAIDKGLKEICFLDHFIASRNPLSSMAINEVALYFQAIQHYKYAYQDKIKVKAGLEVDFIPSRVEMIKETIDRFAFDMIGSSVHFVNGHTVTAHGSAQDLSPADFDDLCLAYLDRLDLMLDHDYFDVICHLDVPKKFNQQSSHPFTEKYDEILSKISYKKVAVEVNTSGYNHPVNEIYPAEWILEKCLEKGIHLTLGSDSHHPDSVGQHFDQVLSLLSSIGYKSLAAFTGRRRCDISLNDIKP